MALVDDFLDLVQNPKRAAVVPGEPSSDALLALLVHTAFSDGAVDEGEFAFLARVLPGREPDELMKWVSDIGRSPLDLTALAMALPTVEERWKGVRFAARMAWKDGSIQQEERDLLERLAVALDLPDGAVDRVIAEMRGLGDSVSDTRITEVLMEIPWRAVQLASGPLESDLRSIVPADWVPAARVGLENVEVLGFFQQGLAGRFLEGLAFLQWNDIVTYTRVPTFGAAVQIHVEDGRTFTLVDARLRGLAAVLDRLYNTERPASEPPVVEVVRGR